MNGPARITALAIALTGMVLSLGGCNRLAARDQLNKGVDAYKSARYEEAIGHFQKATELDPSLPMAKSYLATAGRTWCGLITPDNLKTARNRPSAVQEVARTQRCEQPETDCGHLFQHQEIPGCQGWRKVLAVVPGSRAAYTWRDQLDPGPRGPLKPWCRRA